MGIRTPAGHQRWRHGTALCAFAWTAWVGGCGSSTQASENGSVGGAEAVTGASGGGANGASESTGGSSGAGRDGNGGTGGAAPEPLGGAGPASSGGHAGSADVGGAVPTLSGLTVEPNPNSTLSAFVSWTTDVAADSAVEFGQGGYEYVIRKSEGVTEHRVLVIGMRADSTYQLRAVSTTGAGSGSSETSFMTGSLPSTVPTPELTASAAGAQEGWTFVSVQPPGEGFGASGEPGVIVGYDMEGVPVWYYVNGDRPEELGDASIEVLPNGNLLIGPNTYTPPKEVDLAGNVVWAGPEQPDGGGNGTPGLMTHDARKLGNGNYVLLRNEMDENDFEGALVEEVTPDNQVVWSWSLFDHIQPDVLVDSPDWCHPNAVTIDEEEGFLYLSCRWLGLIKAERGGDGAVVWTLGEGLDGGSFTFDPPEGAFADQHDPERQEDGSVLVYDNGGYTLRPTGDEHSRVIELALDESAMVATLSWSFPGDFAVDSWYREDWYTPFWGDADRLANGNVLITAGMRSSTSGRIFEVRREDGQVVWELTFAPQVGTYQADRASPAPLVERL